MDLLTQVYFSIAVLTLTRGERLIPPPPLITDQPYFDSSMLVNQTAHVGRQAELHCRVHSIGNRTVSWIRGRDLRILTVGRYTYTTDLRYEALHQNGTNQWTLRIRSAQPRDQGTYECQVSTKPVKTFNTFLRVLEPRGEILGSPDLYVQKGSMINLTCVLHDLPEPPRYVRWYHSNKHHSNKNISYSSSRGGVSLIVEKGPTTISHLLITSARVEDKGVYTCAPSNLNSTSVTLHVLNGEHPAAMQTNSAAAVLGSVSLLLAAAVARILCQGWVHALFSNRV
ncbi:zwei Ig domain protein zig-8-like isoform X1 [Portunus trituberculatus]|uniref:zwei Ig domain protein zig-8-like isoform X1 n=1 Tax=Portunus trituberculatus TaxID=210409 RepID=UPI001E1CEEB5|nr:zwei Ig domain protein zig-8-like isoform X1 [Portunus trituberculatus]